MSFLSSLTAKLPFPKKQAIAEVLFGLNIGSEIITAALWTLQDNKLKILDTAFDSYTGEEGIMKVTDKLLDVVVADREIDPQKILFGVPDSWLVNENLKEDNLKLLRKLVKELELTPIAYVSGTSALVHFLEKQEGVPTTAILAGLESRHLVVTVVRAGKVDRTKEIIRSDDLGADIEKVLLSFTGIEVLPSKMLIYGLEDIELDKIKAQLLSFSWMSKLSFLHFPKIEALDGNVAVVGVCFAGASEMDSKAVYVKEEKKQAKVLPELMEVAQEKEEVTLQPEPEPEELQREEPLGFMVGDVAARTEIIQESNLPEKDYAVSVEDFESPQQEEVSLPARVEQKLHLPKTLPLGFIKKIIPKEFNHLPLFAASVGIFLAAISAYLFLIKADINIFVEPKILENSTQIIADPAIKVINESDRKIPGEIVEAEISGSGKGTATGKKQVGEEAKGTVLIRNKTDEAVTLSKGTTLTSGSLNFSLDLAVTIASRSADDGTWGKVTGTVTASAIGADGNLPSGSDLTVSGYSGSQLIAKAEGNFSGGNSKDVTVVSSEDQQKLLAQVAADLRKQAQSKLQEKLPDKKVLEESLSETLVKKAYNKGVNDQASEFTLNLTARYKGTAFDDKDLRTIVSKLVSTNVPAGFSLDLANAQTQADVSSIEKDGRVIFLAKFKAKLIPNLNTGEIKKAVKGKSATGAIDAIKEIDNVLGAEIKLTPALPSILQRIPFLEKNIDVEVGFK